MSASSLEAKTTSELELLNKQLAQTQARQINKELTRLKRVSDHSNMKAPVEADKTGQFIVVPLNTVQGDTIEKAHGEAVKTCTDSGIEMEKSKKRKKWFKWG